MSNNSIEFKIENNIGWLILNRPEVFNSFNREMALRLQDNLDSCENDPEIRAIVITGNGKISQELYGNRYEQNELTVQYFEIVPKDPEEKFSFELKAVDSRGRVSKPRSYN